MAERTFELPDLGEGITEGELVSWAVEPGDAVEEDQLIAEVETDKALVDVPSPYTGTITELHAEEGELVPVDSTIVTFEVEGAAEASTAESTVAAAEAGAADEPAEPAGEPGAAAEEPEPDQPEGRVFAAPSTRELARELGVDLGTVAGSGPGGRITETDVREAADAGDAAGAAGAAAAAGGPAEPETADAAAAAGETGAAETDEAAEPVVVEGEGAARERTLAMPATRRLAREKGIDINDVPASEEREGEAFVTPGDVRAFAEAAEGAGAPPAAGGASAGADSGAGGAADVEAGGATDVDYGSGERVPYRGVRRTIGEQMAQSKFTAPHVSHHDEFDATDLVAIREELAPAAESEGVNLTYLPFVVKAVVSGLKEYPYLNASLDEDAEEIVLHDEYNIGIAVATDAGLMVPVVEHADRKGLKELAADIQDLAERARNRNLSPEEMTGGTFTITNIGVIGGEYSSPIINYPEAAILAMGPIDKRPWVVDDEVVARETMTLSMSVDHRLVDGAEAAQFTNRVQELLADPTRLLLE